MKPLTQIAHDAVAHVLKPGDIAVDLTAGNGWDTLFLARCVGSTGHVYAYDIQTQSIDNTNLLLKQQAYESRVTLFQESHAAWSLRIPIERRQYIKAVMMNLGYLPGGDKSIVTQLHSTRTAIQSALEWLQPEGLLSILAYPGHPGGQAESDAVQAILVELDATQFEVTFEQGMNAPHSPILNFVYKK